MSPNRNNIKGSNTMRNSGQRMKCMTIAAVVGLMSAGAAEKKDMPKKDVVAVPAIGSGLCVTNC